MQRCNTVSSEAGVATEEIVALQPADYPDDYVDCAHPTDYKLLPEPVTEHINHQQFLHSCLHIRLSFKVRDTFYLPMTFVIDTGAPRSMYLCKK